jgi:pyruvate ferredoxin oxidoreductase alpha subunit
LTSWNAITHPLLVRARRDRAEVAQHVLGVGTRPLAAAGALELALHQVVVEVEEVQPLTFMDLDWRIVNLQLEREAQVRRSGPIAENLLRDVGAVASKVS